MSFDFEKITLVEERMCPVKNMKKTLSITVKHNLKCSASKWTVDFVCSSAYICAF